MNSVLYKGLFSFMELFYYVTLYKWYKEKKNRTASKWINNMACCPWWWLCRLTVDCVEGGGRKRYAKWDLSLLSVSLFLCLSFLPCLPTWEHRSEGRDADSDMWKLSSVEPPYPCFVFFPYFLWPPRPLLPSVSLLSSITFRVNMHAPRSLQ